MPIRYLVAKSDIILLFDKVLGVVLIMRKDFGATMVGFTLPVVSLVIDSPETKA